MGGAKQWVPEALTPLSHGLGVVLRHVPLPFPVAMPMFAPSLLVQFIHEDDVGQAFVACIVGAGPPGAYNISGDGVLTGADVVREMGLRPVPVPAAPVEAAARLIAALPKLPFLPPLMEWAEAFSHPSVMDTSKAERELGWKPRYTSIEALRTAVERWSRS